MINIILVDDHPIIGEALSFFLSKNPDFNFLGRFKNVADTQKNYSNEIDISLLDIGLPDQNGIELCKWIKHNYPRSKVIFFTMFFDELIIARAMKAGGDGYLTKNEGFEKVITALKTVMAGENYYSEEIERILLKKQTFKNVKTNYLPILTSREIDVLKLLIKGLSSKEIANQLFLSAKTVEFHRSNLLMKFDVKNVAELIAESIKLGIV